MRAQAAAFFRTTLPLDFPALHDIDDGRYHSALIMTCLLGDEAELHAIASTPLVKAFLLLLPGSAVCARGFEHPMGDGWRGIHNLDPGALTREMVIDILGRITPEMVPAMVTHRTPEEVAAIFATYVPAGLRVPQILDYGGMAGLGYAVASARKVRAAEDAFVRLTGRVP